MALRIGELARRAGVTPATLRYYEAVGLLAPACRTEGGYRVYDAGALGRIEFIHHAKQLGLSIGEIRRLLSSSAADAKEDAATLRRLVAGKLKQIRERTVELRAREARLEALRARLATANAEWGRMGDSAKWLWIDEEVLTMGTGVKGWMMAGSHPGDYEAGVDTGERFDGHPVAYLRSCRTPASGFGTLMQTISPEEFSGKRVKFSGAVRSESLTGWAGLWMRVDSPVSARHLAFDNMQDRPIKGITDWTRYAVVLDVDESAAAIAFGVLASGEGKLWLSDFSFDVVTEDEPVTGAATRSRPENLDFSSSDG
ncbi:MAG TPA: MerR family transcriptional regulator [Candidatus Dormibacteraeota bacterium]|nr:MerR family transcriptional regulator [Candidatus Dormibacteraeota bacterium]